MSEFPFPPERLWTQYEGGVDAGPPPPKPVQGDFMIFGAQLQTDTPSDLLASSGVPKHFDSDDPAKASAEMKKLHTALLETFLALLDEMIANPTVGGFDADGRDLFPPNWVPPAATVNLDRLKELFLNFHHLLNQARPGQAREELLAMLEAQALRRSAVTANLNEETATARKKLVGCLAKLTGERERFRLTTPLCISGRVAGWVASWLLGRLWSVD